MTSLQQHRERRPWELFALAAAVVLAAALRTWRMDAWSFEADEIYTLRDSVILNPRNPRPLMYLLNHYLVLPFTGPSETSLRLLPVLFGILGIPVLYAMARRVTTARAALVAALLLAVSPLHIVRSQYARYWTLIFLLTTLYPLAAYLAVYERRRRWLVVSLLGVVAATLAHPSGSLPFAGVGLWLAIIALQEPRVREVLWRPRARLTIGAILLAGVVALGTWFVPILSKWIASPQQALRGPAMLMSYVDGLTAAVVLTGVAGIAWLWLEGQRSLAILLASVAAVPVALLFGVSLVGAVPTAYLFATGPAYFIGAGIFVDRLATLPIAPPLRRLVWATYALVLAATLAPLLVSHYRDGNRPDLRAVAAQLRTEVRPGDTILADDFPVLRHYLPGQAVDTLKRDPADLAAEAARAHGATPPRAMWVVALTSRRGGFSRRKMGLGPMADWLYSHCQLRSVVGVPRLDYRQNEVQTFLCSPPGAPGAPPVPAAARASSSP